VLAVEPGQAVLVEIRVPSGVEHFFDPAHAEHVVATGRDGELKVLGVVVAAVGSSD